MPNDLPMGIARWIDDFRAACAKAGIPSPCRAGLEAYALHGQPVGDFLNAVLANNFSGAVTRADPVNSRLLREYALLMHNDMPRGSFGSPQHVASWESTGGLVGRATVKI